MACVFSTLLLAEGVSFDMLTGRVSAFNILDSIFTQGAPACIHRIGVLVLYELDTAVDTFSERVMVRAPDGRVVAQSVSTVVTVARHIGMTPSTHRSFHMFWQTVLPVYGDYVVTLERGDALGTQWVTLATRRLMVSSDQHPLFPRQPAAFPPTSSTRAKLAGG